MIHGEAASSFAAEKSIIKQATRRVSKLGRRPLFHLSAPPAPPPSPPASPPLPTSPPMDSETPREAVSEDVSSEEAAAALAIQTAARGRSVRRKATGMSAGRRHLHEQPSSTLPPPRLVEVSLGAVVFGGVHICAEGSETSHVPRLVALQLSSPLVPPPAMVAAVQQRQAAIARGPLAHSTAGRGEAAAAEDEYAFEPFVVDA